MKSTFSITLLAFRKLIRERIVFAVFFVSILMIALSLLLGSLTFDERLRVLVHLGGSAIHLSILGIAIVLGSSVIRNEIKDQTILIILARPIHRAHYYIGQYLGLASILITIWAALTLILYTLIWGELSFFTYLQAMTGSLFEVLIILAFVVFMSILVRSVIAIFSGIGLFLIGNWLEELQYFAKKSNDKLFMGFSDLIYNYSPQLFRTNWRSVYLIQNHLVSPLFGKVFLHTLVWVLILVLFGTIAFRKKDLV